MKMILLKFKLSMWKKHDLGGFEHGMVVGLSISETDNLLRFSRKTIFRDY